MGRRGISYEDVVSAIDTLIARGEHPGLNQIRALLGTGSPNTVQKHKTTWLQTQPQAQRKAPELPADLQTAIVNAFERQAADARADLERNLAEAQREAATLADAGEELEETVASLEDKNTELAAEKERLTALSNERHDEIENLNNKLDAERKSLEESHIQVAQGRNKIESLQGDIFDLKDRIKQLSDEYKLAEKGRIESEKSAAVAEARLESEVKVSADLRNQLENMTRKHDELAAEIRSIQKENHILSDKNGSLSRDLKDCENSHAIEHENVQNLEARIAELEAENLSLKKMEVEK